MHLEPKWRNFAITAIITITIASILILSQLPKTEEKEERTFLEKYTELSQAWKKHGIKQNHLHGAFPTLLKTNNKKLEKIKADLEEYKNSKDERITLLAKAYTDYTEFAIETKDHNQALNQVKNAHQKNTCETYPLYKKLNTETQNLISLASTYSAKTQDFNTKYPQETKQIKLKALQFNQNKAIQQLKKQKEAVQYFKEECENK